MDAYIKVNKGAFFTNNGSTMTIQCDTPIIGGTPWDLGDSFSMGFFIYAVDEGSQH